MSMEIRVPQLPESVSDATIATWLKQEGDTVLAEEPLLELETDKVVLEIPAPHDGILSEIRVEQGTTVLQNDILAILTDVSVSKSSNAATEDSVTHTDKNLFISPSVRKSMHENDVSLEEIHATGDKGRVLKSDVKQAVESRNDKPKAETVPKTENALKEEKTRNQQPAVPTSPASTSDHSSTDARPQKRVPMSRLRQRVGERLVEAQQTAAILSTFNEVDLSDLVRLRKTYQERFQHAHQIKLGYMSFFVKAATEALKRFPEVNARIDNNDIIYHGYYDIGVAVSTDRGLVVPVIRNTDRLGHADIEKAIMDYALRARDGKLELDELTGGTFSITNGGIFGSMLSTPIINPPQSGILGMHKIDDRVVVRNGEMVIRPMMYLALSYDHRIIDGKTAVSFLVKIKDLLEDPASLLLEL